MLTRHHTDLPATHTFIHTWNKPILPLLPSRSASPHFGRYSFPLPAEGRRLSWLGWLGEVLRWFALPARSNPILETVMRKNKLEASALNEMIDGREATEDVYFVTEHVKNEVL